jgi:hypothetical protein
MRFNQKTKNKAGRKLYQGKLLLLLLIIAGSFLMASQALAAKGLVGTVLEGVPCAGYANEPLPVPGTNNKYQIAGECGPCDFIRVFVNLSNMFVAFSGLILLVTFIYAGILMMVSSANPKFVDQAKTAIKSALIGLVLIFGGYTIVNFLISALYGGVSDSSVINSAYSEATGGQESWGVCKDTK